MTDGVGTTPLAEGAKMINVDAQIAKIFSTMDKALLVNMLGRP